MSARGLRYIPALDGLRALAVIAVLLYHGNVSWAQGGYFGVDAFFVLSGFLITSLLLVEWDGSGGIGLKHFWARRARRLLPALALVVAFVAVYAAWFAAPIELNQLRRDGLSTLAYSANWTQIFTHQSYFEQFAAPSALKHTWSLAIEEQFYLVWPLLVLAALRVGRGSKRFLLGCCAVLTIGSALEMAYLYQPGHDPSRVYYGTDTRAQSLLIGAILAILLAARGSVRSPRMQTLLNRGAIAAAVALGIIWTTTTDGDAWQYRGGFVIAAVLVAVIIASVAQPGDSGGLGRALSTTPLRAIGIISYGLYLWHWPIYVFLSADRTGVDGSALLAIRLAATFAVAALSYALVESPIRHGALRGPSLRIAVPAVALALAIVVVTSTAAPVPVRFSATSASQLRPPSIPKPVAATGTAAGSNRPVRVMLVGDSVADSLAPGLATAVTARGDVFWNASVPGCGIASDVGERWFGEWRGVDPHCLPGWRQRWPGEVAAFKPDVVVALFGGQDAFDRRIDGHVIKFDTADGAALAHEELQGAVNILSSSGAHVVLLSTPYYVLGWPQKVQVDRSTLNPAWINRFNDVEQDVATAQPHRVTLLDLNHYLDPEGRWTDTVDGIKVRTFDKNHLSPAGAAFVTKWLMPQLASYQPNA